MHLNVLIALFQKMLWFIGVWATAHEILAIKISKKMLTQQKFNKIFRLKKISENSEISETVSHSIMNNTIFWKYVTRPFRWIYVNCFSRLRFLAEVSTKFPKNALFRLWSVKYLNFWPKPTASDSSYHFSRK